MAGDADAGIVREHARQPLVHLGAAVGDDHEAGVDRVADPDAAAVVHRHPRGARRRREQRVQHRPVGDRVGAVLHRLGLAERRGHRAGVEVVAADHDRRRHLAAADEVVEDQPGLGTVAVAEPADPRRQALERDPLGREVQPPLQQGVVGERLEQGAVDAGDVGRIARERRPPERPGADAEERPHVGGHEPGEPERVLEAGVARLGAQVVAVVEDVAARLLCGTTCCGWT